MGLNREKSPHKTGKAWEPDARQLEIYNAVCRGKGTYKEIGAMFDIGAPAVCYVMKRVNEWLVPVYMNRIREIKSEHSERLAIIYAEAMQAWDRSKEPATTTKTGTQGLHSVNTVTTKGRDGDPKYLTVAMNALADIRKIWGADAPVKIEQSTTFRFVGKTPEENRSAAHTLFKTVLNRPQN